MSKKHLFTGFVILLTFIAIFPGCQIRRLKPIRVIAELKIGETQDVKLTSMKHVRVKLIEIKEIRDSLRNAIREAYVKVSVDGKEIR